jgi:hypothetical protein
MLLPGIDPLGSQTPSCSGTVLAGTLAVQLAAQAATWVAVLVAM